MNESKITYLVSENIDFNNIHSIKPFDEKLSTFFDMLSKELLNNKEAKAYPDVVTFAFYIRKSNVIKLKEKFENDIENNIKMGRGVVFHIAPSNVPVNFAYSLFVSLICGNANIVKVSSKDFIQVNIICEAINKVLNNLPELKKYINVVRYDNDKEINDYFSSICDIRVIWGGDETISLIRESKLKPRALEITFADRYSLAVIDSEYYKKLNDDEKKKIATGFYNDTFLTDQNACTSPRLICFLGDICDEFYQYAENEIESKYNLNDISGSDKLVDSDKFAIDYKELNPKFSRIKNKNFIYRITIDKIFKDLINFKGNSGLFIDCVIKNINEIFDLCNNDKVQTISYVGDKNMFTDLVNKGIKGVDRIVPIGKTMDFDFIWDGYNLSESLTKNINII